MSIKLMSMVWDLDLPPGEKLVLLALADQANDEGRQCWPAVRTIMRRSGQGERTVRRAIADLETKGHLTIQHRDGTSSQYHVHPCQIGTPAKSAPLPNTTLTPAKLAGKPSNRNTNKNMRATRLADDWVVPEITGPSLAIWKSWDRDRRAQEVEAFRDYWANQIGAKGCKLDWTATWRTWIKNGERFHPTLAESPC